MPELQRGMVLFTNKNDGEAEASLSDLAAAILAATYGAPAVLQMLAGPCNSAVSQGQPRYMPR